MDRHDSLTRSVASPPLNRWGSLAVTVLIAVGSYFLLVFIFFNMYHSKTFTFGGVGDVGIAHKRVEQCRSKDEILAILGNPGWRNDTDTEWRYYDSILQSSALGIRFDAQGRPIEMLTWCI